MEYSTVFIVGLLAITSFAINSDVSDCNKDVDLTLIRDAYNAGLRSYPLPKYQLGQNVVNTFIENFMRNCVQTAEGLRKIFCEHIKENGKNLIRNLTIYRDDLRKAIKTTNNNKDPLCLDNPLKSLKNQCDIFLALIPGNALIKRPGLPEIPPQQIPTQNITRTLTLDESFVNLDQFIDSYFANAYSFVTGMYQRGWNASRSTFNTAQSLIRNKILNGPVLNFYAEVTKEFLGQSQLIQSRVKKETWQGFKAVGDRIQLIFKDWKTSMNNKTSPK